MSHSKSNSAEEKTLAPEIPQYPHATPVGALRTLIGGRYGGDKVRRTVPLYYYSKIQFKAPQDLYHNMYLSAPIKDDPSQFRPRATCRGNHASWHRVLCPLDAEKQSLTPNAANGCFEPEVDKRRNGMNVRNERGSFDIKAPAEKRVLQRRGGFRVRSPFASLSLVRW